MCGNFSNSKSCFKSPRCSRSISDILIGDIECKTYKAQDADEYTGLEESALEEVRKITHFERKYHLWRKSRGSNSAIMSET